MLVKRRGARLTLRCMRAAQLAVLPSHAYDTGMHTRSQCMRGFKYMLSMLSDARPKSHHML